jgi:hypothetical protein
LDDKNKVIIIESVIKSDIFLKYLKKLIIDILHENNISFSSIKKDGFYYVLELKKSNEIVFTMDLLSKVSGISCIFIAKPLVVDYNILSQRIIQIWKEILLPGEKFYITITLSNEKDFKKKNEFIYFRKDLEFFLISELSSFSIDIKYVRNEIEADKILCILIGTDFAYVSLLLKRCKEVIPFKFLKEKVICPLYNEYSFLSLISILENGFFPLPVFFYSSGNQLIKILKSFDKIIKRYPIHQIDINLINLDKVNLDIIESAPKNINDNFDINAKMILELIKEEIIVLILLQMKIESNFICLSFLPFLYPLWFIKKNVMLSFEAGIIPLTPFLFNYDFKSNLKDFYKINNSMVDEQPLDSTLSYLDIEQKNYNEIFQKVVNISKLPSINEIVKFNLDMRKDDVLDILDSI